MSVDSPAVASAGGYVVTEQHGALSRLIVAWQHPASRLISPVGLLDYTDGRYRFRYFQRALVTPDFRPFVGFPDLHRSYSSSELFPFFQQRVMQMRRPDYPRYVKSLALPPGAGPWEQLGRSGGRRLGDTIQLFPEPQVSPDGRTECTFLVHGIRHIERERDHLVQRRIDKLERGDALSLAPDLDNPMNPDAILVCDKRGQPIGWVPNLLLDYVHTANRMGGLRVVVEHANGDQAPYHFRLIARLEGLVPAGYMPFAGPEWEFLSDH